MKGLGKGFAIGRCAGPIHQGAGSTMATVAVDSMVPKLNPFGCNPFVEQIQEGGRRVFAAGKGYQYKVIFR